MMCPPLQVRLPHPHRCPRWFVVGTRFATVESATLTGQGRNAGALRSIAQTVRAARIDAVPPVAPPARVIGCPRRGAFQRGSLDSVIAAIDLWPISCRSRGLSSMEDPQPLGCRRGFDSFGPRHLAELRHVEEGCCLQPRQPRASGSARTLRTWFVWTGKMACQRAFDI